MNFQNPITRWGIALSGAAALAAIALVYLDGHLQLLVLGLAAVDAAVTPWLLKRSVR